MKHTELLEQAKSLSQQLRDTWNPQVEDAADTIDALVKEIEILTAERELYASAMDRMKVEMQAEVERLNSQQVPDWFKEQVMTVQAERDALKLDAERYRWLLTDKADATLQDPEQSLMVDEVWQRVLDCGGNYTKTEVDYAIDAAMKEKP